jgi:predicted HD phosphohydrolase
VPGVSTPRARSVDEVLERLAASDGVFDSLGELGDPIDILAHSLQCAYELEQLAPDDTELQVAGLVHDLGHVLGDLHTVDHGEVGGAWVEPLLGERVARLTVLHVPAKRYLVATDAGYAAELSDGSALSLEFQGGAMTPDEAAGFAADPHGPDAATLRRADEAAKVIGREVPGLDHWAPAVQAVAASRATAR